MISSLIRVPDSQLLHTTGHISNSMLRTHSERTEPGSQENTHTIDSAPYPPLPPYSSPLSSIRLSSHLLPSPPPSMPALAKQRREAEEVWTLSQMPLLMETVSSRSRVRGLYWQTKGIYGKRQEEYRGGAGPRLLVKLEGETQADALLLHRLRLRLRGLGRGGGRGRLLDRQGRGLLGILVYNLLDVVLRGAAAASDWAIESESDSPHRNVLDDLLRLLDHHRPPLRHLCGSAGSDLWTVLVGTRRCA
jgi:hypothetical protein